jgi:hypothetical protein
MITRRSKTPTCPPSAVRTVQTTTSPMVAAPRAGLESDRHDGRCGVIGRRPIRSSRATAPHDRSWAIAAGVALAARCLQGPGSSTRQLTHTMLAQVNRYGQARHRTKINGSPVRRGPTKPSRTACLKSELAASKQCLRAEVIPPGQHVNAGPGQFAAVRHQRVRIGRASESLSPRARS